MYYDYVRLMIVQTFWHKYDRVTWLALSITIFTVLMRVRIK